VECCQGDVHRFGMLQEDALIRRGDVSINDIENRTNHLTQRLDNGGYTGECALIVVISDDIMMMCW